MKIPKFLYLVIRDHDCLHEIYWDSLAETESESIRKYVSKHIGTIDPVYYWESKAEECCFKCIEFEKVKRAVK